MSNLKISVVDDERLLRVTLVDDLKDAGYEVKEYSNAKSLLMFLRENKTDVVITDIMMPDIDGLELLSKLKELDKDIYVVMMTAYATVEKAVSALKKGAYDFLTKPFDSQEILLILNRINELKELKSVNSRLQSKVRENFNFSHYIGNVEDNKELFELIRIAANSESSVLLTGETGTGKELIANIIHYNSSRKNEAFVPVSCAALSREIIESELFGHVKGAFTGAEKDKEGRLQLANNGTLFLDDIDDIPLDIQVKLLRVLEEKEVEKVGSNIREKINIRVISASKINLKDLVDNGKFRSDLYYRLDVFPISLPPLRERKNDIELLIEHYINFFKNKNDIVIDKEAIDVLINYSWPGNVRELRNLVERLILLTTNGVIDILKIPNEIRTPSIVPFCNMIGKKPLDTILTEIEIASIKMALEKTRNNKSKAAEMLGIPASTLHTKLSKYKL